MDQDSNHQSAGSNRINWFYRFLVYFSGANMSVLEQTPSEVRKQARIGTLILIVGIISGFSMLIAVQDFFYEIDQKNQFFGIKVSHLIAFMWSILIITIDILATNSISRIKDPVKRWASASARLALAFAISLAISMPLETLIFKKEIEQKIDDYVTSKIDDFTNKENARLDSLRLRKGRLEAQRDIYIARSGQADSAYISAQGLIAQDNIKLSELRVRLEPQLIEIDRDINDLRSRLRAREEERNDFQIKLLNEQDSLRRLEIEKMISETKRDIRSLENQIREKQGERTLLRRPLRDLEVVISKRESSATNNLMTTKGNLNALLEEIAGLDSGINVEQSLLSAKVQSVRDSLDQVYAEKLDTNFPFKFRKLHEVVDFHGSWTSDTWLYFAFIVLIFAIESTPIIWKAIEGPGVYDQSHARLKKKEEEAFQDLAQKRLENAKTLNHQLAESELENGQEQIRLTHKKVRDSLLHYLNELDPKNYPEVRRSLESFLRSYVHGISKPGSSRRASQLDDWLGNVIKEYSKPATTVFSLSGVGLLLTVIFPDAGGILALVTGVLASMIASVIIQMTKKQSALKS